MDTFRNRDNARQLIVFSDLNWAGATPTDIDFKVEFKNEKQLVGEFKYMNGFSIPLGQRIALEVSNNDYERAGKEAIAFIAVWNWNNVDEHGDIVASDCMVVRYFQKGVWTTLEEFVTVKKFCTDFLYS